MNADKAKSLAKGRWIEILLSLAPVIINAIARIGHHVPCPVHGGTDGFRAYGDVNQSGGTVCNTCGSFPDGFSTLMWINGWDFRTALQAVNSYLDAGHVRHGSVERQLPKSKREEERLCNALNRTWKEAVPLSDVSAEPARLYLANRAIHVLPGSNVVRFHPSLSYYDGEQWVDDFPAIVSMVSDAAGKAATIHRTFITEDGRKAPVPFQKKLMRYPEEKSLTGGAIRLGKGETVLAVAEGLETALSVAQGMGLPVWCVINANLLEKFIPPASIGKIIVFADKDLPTKQHPGGHGQEAARNLVQRLWQAGVKASIAIPEGEIPAGRKSLDWNDVLLLKGNHAFQAEKMRISI